MRSSPGASVRALTLPSTSVHVEFLHRPDQVLALRGAFDELASGQALPATGWSAWSFAGCAVDGSAPTWGAVAHNGAGELAGLVLLTETSHGGRRLLTLAGTEQDVRGVLTVDSPETAEALAQALDSHLRNERTPAELLLGPLDANDPSVHAFAAALPGASLVPDEPVPALDAVDTSVEEHLSHGMRRTLRKAQNRLERDNRSVAYRFTCDGPEILGMAGDMEQCHRERDHVHGRESDLDDELGRRVWRWRLRELAALGCLELGTLHIDDEFAAYALGVVDGDTYRVLEGRFVTSWGRYAPGRLLEAAMLQRVVESPQLTRTDWLSSVAPETLIAANDDDPMVRIHCSWDV